MPRPATKTIAITRSAGVALVLIAVLGFADVSRADNVHLHNGRTFEDVIVVAEREDAVEIRLSFGELSLPRSWVERIERSSSPLETFLRREQELRQSELPVSARDWLELAIWAGSKNLGHGHREALLKAAALDPHLPGLAAEMRGLEYALDEELDLWLPYAEIQRRAGRVLHRGEWISSEELDALRSEQRAARLSDQRQRREAADRSDDRDPAAESLGRVAETLALAELERATAERERATQQAGGQPYGNPFHHANPFSRGHGLGYGSPVYPVVVVPGFFFPVEDENGANERDGKSNRGGYDALLRRQPGSLLVGKGSIASLARVRRQPGALALRRR